MILYFAYGSNMLPARLIARCPGAKVAGTATATGHALRFWKHGRDGSGKATLVAHPGHQTPGVLYHLPPQDLPALDAAEGAGTGYDRHDQFALTTPKGGRLMAMTYIAQQPEPDLIPFDWYLALCRAGAAAHGLATTHLASPTTPDPIPDRPARLAALLALSSAKP